MWIKICGIRSLENADRVIPARPEAIGLNFYTQTPRHVNVETAKTIIDRLPDAITPVGVFVNHSPDEVNRICAETGLRTVQLHGDETPDVVAEIAAADPQRKIIRAFRAGQDGLKPIAEELQAYAERKVALFACLIDARVAGRYGGTGETAPWELLRDEYDTQNWPPLILAGGLSPENVATGIDTVRPWGVDVAGGVESAVGEKDAGMVRRFADAVRMAPEDGQAP